MKLTKSRKVTRGVRHARVRRKVSGTAECPRMSVMISNRHMYVQFIDDEAQRTLASASTLGVESQKVNVACAAVLGRKAGECALKAGIQSAVVDRGGHRFHGRLRALVDATRAAGIRIGTVRPRAEAAAEDSGAAGE